jgi:hypothetical protein
MLPEITQKEAMRKRNQLKTALVHIVREVCQQI